MSLKTENSRRVAKSRPVCMGLDNAVKDTLHGTTRYSYIMRLFRMNIVDLKLFYAKNGGHRLYCVVYV
jgi:hypothetical protein